MTNALFYPMEKGLFYALNNEIPRKFAYAELLDWQHMGKEGWLRGRIRRLFTRRRALLWIEILIAICILSFQYLMLRIFLD
jgi:hypothetical protein